MITADVLVIGAGMSGLTIANELHKQGKTILCVEKARGSGGRLSSKRVLHAKGDVVFDLGCSAFTARTPIFKHKVNEWCDAGVLQTWTQFNDEQWYVGQPRSSSITRYLAGSLEVQFSTRITRLEKHRQQWAVYIEDNNRELCYALVDDVIISAPAPQCCDLLPSDHPLQYRIKKVAVSAQWVVMLALRDALNMDELCVSPSVNITRISYENSKPHRHQETGLHVYTVQASHEWSDPRTDYSKDKVLMELTNEVAELTQQPLHIEADYCHRWLYAQNNQNGFEASGFLSSDDGIHICADYLAQDATIDGVEAAYLSAMALSEYLMQPVVSSMSS